MRRILNFLFVTVILFFILIAYFVFTASGQKSVHSIISFYATSTSGVPIDIEKLSLGGYPHIHIKGTVDKVYKLDIDGSVKNKNVDLKYTLNSEYFKSDIATFDDTIRLKGTIKGWRGNLHINGQGEIFGGSAAYALLKQKKIFKDMNLKLRDVNSSKILALVNQQDLFHGKADADVHFDTFGKKHKIGFVDYRVADHNFYGIDAHIQANMDINDTQYRFVTNLTSPDVRLKVKNGTYDQSRKYAHADYTLDVTDLNALEVLLDGKYNGPFHATGEIVYDKKLHIKGLSKDFGGNLHFTYDTKTLDMLLENIAFHTLMEKLNQNPIADANMSGKIVYDFTQKVMRAKTKLKHTKLIPSSLTKKIQKRFAIDLDHAIFDDSALNVHYHNKLITSTIKLANKNMHLILTGAKLNEAHDAMDTQIDIQIPKHSAKGKLHVKLNQMDEKHTYNAYLTFDGLAEKHYQVKLDGLLTDSFMNMQYNISAGRLPSFVTTIVDDINLSGHIDGRYERVHVSGQGLAMEGQVNFSGTKLKDSIKDVNLDFQHIHALKLFTLLGLPDFPTGKANLKGQFSYLGQTKKKGHLTYHLYNGKYETLPLKLRAEFDVNDTLVTYTSDAVLSTAEINVSRGKYHLNTDTSKAFYSVQTNDLAPLEPLIGKYLGPFNTSGEISYKNKKIQVRGLTNTFGGMIDYLYKEKDNMLYIDLEKISLYRFMQLFPYPKILDAQVVGNINYDYNKEKLLVKAKLNNARFLDSDLTRKVRDKAGVDLSQEIFTHSILSGSFYRNRIVGNLLLRNRLSHVYLSNVEIDEKRDTVNAFFDIQMQRQAFSGKIYGSTEKPKINLNFQKLIRYQMDKQMDTYMGEENRKMMDSMPMENTAKDVASEMGGGFIHMFF